MKNRRNDYVNLSKFLSLILRHKPEVIGIELDQHGWANVEELIRKVNRKGYQIDGSQLDDIVKKDDKQRYTYNEERTKIRANQGHSLSVDVGLQQLKPPSQLYHGTVERYLKAIKKEGLRPMSRQYVHLSEEIETATKVGQRRGRPVLLKINALAMYLAGHKFYQSKNGVWLCDFVPAKYIHMLNN